MDYLTATKKEIKIISKKNNNIKQCKFCDLLYFLPSIKNLDWYTHCHKCNLLFYKWNKHCCSCKISYNSEKNHCCACKYVYYSFEEHCCICSDIFTWWYTCSCYDSKGNYKLLKKENIILCRNISFWHIKGESIYKEQERINNGFIKFLKLYKKYKFKLTLWKIAEYYTKKKYSPENILKYINLDLI